MSYRPGYAGEEGLELRDGEVVCAVRAPDSQRAQKAALAWKKLHKQLTDRAAHAAATSYLNLKPQPTEGQRRAKRRRLAAQLRLKLILQKGDVVGHEFHGNQWTEGEGRSEQEHSGSAAVHEFGHAGQRVAVKSEDEIAALENYFEDSQVNTDLRRGVDPSRLEDVSHLDAVVNRNTIPEGTIAYRGIRDEAGGLLKQLKSGAIVSDRGYQSWTELKGTAQDFNGSMEGTKGGFVIQTTFKSARVGLRAGGDMKELILPRNTRMFYRGVSKETGFHMVEVMRG